MHSLPSVEDMKDIRGKRVLLRASLNVPLEDGVVRNDFRLREALPTIEALRARGARVILFGHIGREPHETLRPVYEALKKCLPLTWAEGLLGPAITKQIAALQNGDVLMLENVRSDVREEENDDAFAKELATLGDVYVNDAFSDSHRAHASIVGIPKYVQSYFGLTFVREYTELGKAMEPKSPSLLILGGAKFETKMPLIEKYSKIYDHVFVGGALANDIFKGKGYEVGVSLVSSVDLTGSPLLKNEQVIAPIDVVVDAPSGRHIVAPEGVTKDEKIMDAGPATIEMLRPYVMEARTILWNGPLGNYEAGFPEYTEALARLVAESDAFSIVGGGDTVATVEALGADTFGFVSTAGGAMLTFLETGTLPAIDAVLKQ